MKVLVIGRGPTTVHRVLPLIEREGLDAVGTTSDDDAVGEIEMRHVDAVVVDHGIEEESRERLLKAAERCGVPVVDGWIRGDDPADYVREELVPELRRKAH
jgi:hypothetical protein